LCVSGIWNCSSDELQKFVYGHSVARSSGKSIFFCAAVLIISGPIRKHTNAALMSILLLFDKLKHSSKNVLKDLIYIKMSFNLRVFNWMLILLYAIRNEGHAISPYKYEAVYISLMSCSKKGSSWNHLKKIFWLIKFKSYSTHISFDVLIAFPTLTDKSQVFFVSRGHTAVESL